MLTPECLQEFRTTWLPHITDCGLDHLIDLLERDSPYLIHGSFARAVPQGCLATHIAWRHPQTEHLTPSIARRLLAEPRRRRPGTRPPSTVIIRALGQSERLPASSCGPSFLDGA